MRKWIILAAVLLMAASPVSAQKATKKPEPKGALGFAWLMPRGNLETSHDKGYGIHLMFAYPFADKMDLSITTGWNRMIANEDGNPEYRYGAEDFTMWEITAGPRARIKWFYIGVEFGYFTDVGEWSWVPNAGVRYKRFDLGYRVKASDNVKINTVRIGYFF